MLWVSGTLVRLSPACMAPANPIGTGWIGPRGLPEQPSSQPMGSLPLLLAEPWAWGWGGMGAGLPTLLPRHLSRRDGLASAGEAGVVSSPYLWCPQVPIKWMALESILHRIYTHQSDVWSYGESGRNPEAVGDLVPGWAAPVAPEPHLVLPIGRSLPGRADGSAAAAVRDTKKV